MYTQDAYQRVVSVKLGMVDSMLIVQGSGIDHISIESLQIPQF